MAYVTVGRYDRGDGLRIGYIGTVAWGGGERIQVIFIVVIAGAE
jgi:hypothetical protein